MRRKILIVEDDPKTAELIRLYLEREGHQALVAHDGRLALELACERQPDLPPLDADPERIGQVLRNVLGNAITHTPPGGAIGITARVEGDAVAVSVRDTGSGIAADDLPQIFERFFRADRSWAWATGGAGLGLTIVRQLVEAHGGRVWAESEAGHGATFTFTLPIARPDEEDLIPTGIHQEHEPQR